MASVEEHLRRWLAAGAIEPSAADRIRAHEREQRRAPGQDSDRPGVLEALAYLGVAVASVGAIAFAAQQWDELERWARIAAVAGPAAMAFLAGIGLRLSGRDEVERAASVAWLACVALIAATVGVVGSEYNANENDLVLWVGLITTGAAVALWIINPQHAQVLALAGSLALLAQGVGARADPFSEVSAGLTMLAFGLAGVLLAELGRLEPPRSAGLLFALLAVAGPYFAGLPESRIWAELLVFVVAGALVALSILRGRFAYLLVGVGASFIGLVTFIFEHFEDDVGAPVALMLSGAIVISGVLILARLGPRLQRQKTTP